MRAPSGLELQPASYVYVYGELALVALVAHTLHQLEDEQGTVARAATAAARL